MNECINYVSGILHDCVMMIDLSPAGPAACCRVHAQTRSDRPVVAV